MIFSSDGREPLRYLYYSGPNQKKIDKAKTVHYDFASYSKKNNVYIGYKNGNITLCQNNQKIEGWSKVKSIWFKTFKSDKNNNFYFPFEKNCIRIVVDLDFKKSNDSVYIDVKNIPGEEVRDFAPFGDLRMLLVSYNGIVSVTSSNQVISQMNLHLSKDEVTKALCLSPDEKYFCVSVKNTRPKVPTLRFFKIVNDGESFENLGTIDFSEEDLIRNDYSYFFAMDFSCLISGRPVLTAFQCCNEFRVYSFYIDEDEKVRKIGWRKTESKKFVWDCKFFNGSVFALDRDLNLVRVSYSGSLDKNMSDYGVEYDYGFFKRTSTLAHKRGGKSPNENKELNSNRRVDSKFLVDDSFEEEERDLMKENLALELNLRASRSNNAFNDTLIQEEGNDSNDDSMNVNR